MTTNTPDTERDAFEAYIKSRCPLVIRNMGSEEVLRRNKNGDYWLSAVDSMWFGFQIGRSPLLADLKLAVKALDEQLKLRNGNKR